MHQQQQSFSASEEHHRCGAAELQPDGRLLGRLQRSLPLAQLVAVKV
jgi:hypothetical protein